MPDLASYLIGLREGLEAALVVSILVAFVVKSERRDRLPLIWIGVGAAVVLSVLFGWLLTFTRTSLLSDFKDQERFEAVTSILAVVFVTWMIFWMRKTARTIKGELTAKLAEAISVGAFAVLVMAFLAVAREGIETSVLFYGYAQSAADQAGPLIALTLGVLTAVAIGVALYFGAVRINLSRFFTWTGVLLIFVAGGILKYGVHDFQEAGDVPGLNDLAFDISSWWDPGTWYAELLRGMFNVTATPSVYETVAWVAYIAVVLTFFLWPRRPRAAAPSAPPAPVEATGTNPDARSPKETVER